MLGHAGFTVTPRRGELIVFDKLARPLVRQIVLAVPTKITKGVLIAPTVFGNVMLGPTAEDVERKDDTELDRAPGSPTCARRARASCRRCSSTRSRPSTSACARRPSTPTTRCRSTPTRATPASAGSARPGSRPRWRSRSTCASSSARRACALEPRADRPPESRMPNIGESVRARPTRTRRADRERPRLRPDRLLLRAGHARGDPRRARLARAAPSTSTACAAGRAPLMGRCQGFFCGAELAALLAERTRVSGPGRDRRRRPGRARGGDRAAPARVPDVLVLEREREAAESRGTRGTRASGCATCAGCMSGPRYARRLPELALRAGAELRTETMVTGWSSGGGLELTVRRAAARRSCRRRWCSPPAAASGRARPGSCRARGLRA